MVVMHAWGSGYAPRGPAEKALLGGLGSITRTFRDCTNSYNVLSLYWYSTPVYIVHKPTTAAFTSVRYFVVTFVLVFVHYLEYRILILEVEWYKIKCSVHHASVTV